MRRVVHTHYCQWSQLSVLHRQSDVRYLLMISLNMQSRQVQRALLYASREISSPPECRHVVWERAHDISPDAEDHSVSMQHRSLMDAFQCWHYLIKMSTANGTLSLMTTRSRRQVLVTCSVVRPGPTRLTCRSTAPFHICDVILTIFTPRR